MTIMVPDHRYLVVIGFILVFYGIYRLSRDLHEVSQQLRNFEDRARTYAEIEQQDMWEIRLYHNQLRKRLDMRPIPVRRPLPSTTLTTQQQAILEESQKYQ